MLTITPRCPSWSGSVAAICSAATASTLKVPTRLTWTTLAYTPRSCTPFLPRIRIEGPMPAQLTTVRRGTSAAAACSTAVRTCASSVTSVGT